MRAWTVAGGLIELDGRLLLVQNQRRDGSLDWTTPGGVIDPGEQIIEGLTREVEEETGLRVAGWEGPLWTVRAEAPDMGWTLDVEVHRAMGFDGDITVDDPDGIVVDAAWLDLDGCRDCLGTSWIPAREPMLAWLGERWTDARSFRYRVEGQSRDGALVTRLD
ncbi:MAG: NUDIX hydrolase [Acidimicrobiales bacterium]|nr:NUDIX hydrolase [Acidimicrobiales bacterium]